MYIGFLRTSCFSRILYSTYSVICYRYLYSCIILPVCSNNILWMAVVGYLDCAILYKDKVSIITGHRYMYAYICIYVYIYIINYTSINMSVPL